MADTCLLVDVSYLAHRAWHTTGGLHNAGEEVGVSFGVIQAIDHLSNHFGSVRTVLAFDSGGGGLRAQIRPEYKANRAKDETEEEKVSRHRFYQQIDDLRARLLPEIGYKNIFKFRGFEADDIIASACDGVTDAVIVTSDNDLWQCLTGDIRWYNPTTKKLVTAKSFKAIWGIEPVSWSTVKAAAGCISDNVKGIDGVGEKTAVDWLRGVLKEGSKRLKAIDDGLETINSNLPLVKLPFKGTPELNIVDDQITETGRRTVDGWLGIRDCPRTRQGTPSGFQL